MKMNLKTISLLAYVVGTAFAKDKFFNGVPRAQLFEKTDFKVPNIIINLNEDDYKNYFLRYQCERDMNTRYLVRNDDCYKAPWVDLDSALSKAFKSNLIDKNLIQEKSDLDIVNKQNITLSEFEHIVITYTNFTLEHVLSTGYGLIKLPDYEAENASLTFDNEGEVTEIEKIKFSVGGKYTRNFEKLGYNIKIKKDQLFERKQLRLRSEAVDPSFLREKLAYDICNLVGLPSLSLNFAKVYFNDKYMGLFAMRDAFKSQWIQYNFGEKGTTHLYTCDRSYGNNKYFNCKNDDEEITEDIDFKMFQDRLSKTTTRAELEKYFDVKTFMKWQALKYLFGSWDHVTNAHNSYLYMYHNAVSGKDLWIPLLYDFDSEFGAYKNANPRRRFNEEIYDKTNPIFDILNIKDNNPEIISYIDEIMKTAFNPVKLIPRIDELKKFIGPYVKEDRATNDKGELSGRVKRLNIKIEDYFTYDDFMDTTEFTKLKLRKYQSDSYYTDDYVLGLKHWIIERFKFVCETYKMDCSYAQKYLDMEYSVKTVIYEERNKGCHDTGYNCCIDNRTTVQTTDAVGKWGIENGEWCLLEIGSSNNQVCWATSYGYPCCKSKKTRVSHVEATGEQFGVENGAYCGITDVQLCPSGGEYRCCKGCEIIQTDTQDWGFEDGKWCSIPYTCDALKSNSTATTTVSTTTVVPTETLNLIETPIDGQPNFPIQQGGYYPPPYGQQGGYYPPPPPYGQQGGYYPPPPPYGQQGGYYPPPPPPYGQQGGYYPPPPPYGVCGQPLDWCGGNGYPTCCVQGYACMLNEDRFYQCLPTNSTFGTTTKVTSSTTVTPVEIPTSTTTVTTTVTTTTTTAAAQPTKCAARNQPCGGTEYPDAPNCCEEGTFCFDYFTHHHQCLYNELKETLPLGTNVVTPDNQKCAEPYQSCGGINNMNAPSCCTSGFVCRRDSPTNHQCIPKSAYERLQSKKN